MAIAIAAQLGLEPWVQKKFFGLGEWRNGVGNLYYARDHLGNLRELTDGSSVVRARYEYDPYGRRSANLITGGNALAADWGFTGHYYHANSGLHLAWFRAYDANLGRWISRDPIGEYGGMNLYGYVLGNPISFVDPLGLALSDLITPEGMPPQFKKMLGRIRCGMAAAAAALLAHWHDERKVVRQNPKGIYFIPLGFGIGTISFYDEDTDTVIDIPAFVVPGADGVAPLPGVTVPEVWQDEMDKRRQQNRNPGNPCNCT